MVSIKKFMISIVYGMIVFAIFLLLHNYISEIVTDTETYKTILYGIGKIGNDSSRSIASVIFVSAYDMSLLFIFSLLVIYLIFIFKGIVNNFIVTAVGMTVGSLIVDFGYWAFTSYFSASLPYFLSLMLFSVNKYLSIIVLATLATLCYGIALWVWTMIFNRKRQVASV